MIRQDIGRVILNLVTNAFHAVAERQKEAGEDYKPVVTVSTAENDQFLLISVEDNGVGIPKQALDKIFQPFFTTKPTGHGTGLGLSISYEIVTSHNGKLEVDTEPGQGTEFTVKLPKS